MKASVNRSTGKWLRQLRADKKISQPQLQDYLEVSRSYISNVEQGKKPLPLWRLFQLCRDLDADPSAAVQWISREAFGDHRKKK
jgi:transcriptional regulator with XRE-family HTH domain